MEVTGNIPTGKDLMKTLIELLADQEGVKIKYEWKEHSNEANNNQE